jgi:hypothetical protein
VGVKSTVVPKILCMKKLHFLRNEFVSVLVLRIQSDHGIESFPYFKPEPPFLSHVVGSARLRSDHEHDAFAACNCVSHLLEKSELPRGHRNTVEPNIEISIYESTVQLTHEGFVVSTCIRKKQFGSRHVTSSNIHETTLCTHECC